MSVLLVRTAPLPAGPRAPGYPAARDALLREALAAAGLRLGAGDVALARRCATCGGTDHGKPEVVAALARGRHVSVAHTATRLAVAVADGPCGVDVEDVAAVGRAPVAPVLLAPRERVGGGPPDAEDLARTWVRKEALLKATGHGLAVEPADLVLGPPGAPPRVVRWRGPGRTPRPAGWSEQVLTGPVRAVLTAVVLRAP
ncbi:4'-phosphopantetheinyl transferase superfamily protein [Cellulomonas sp. PhB143]|uniref:4'-phosphopantetheinyl transferase family protein n=1 Tax=Cellulomonas sp. PhB143 TaxID=2485186 RepID=UPI000F4605DD|nr:4'-phosphopantetheinyl transferase superfamily protein [Cellulomonas sp. PhB143]ROS76655.1 4'-phosphopantetheinyl transferase superfamily protein [Cellulomonas sp. PhB143]